MVFRSLRSKIEKALKSAFCGGAVSELQIVKSVSNIEASFVYVNNVVFSSNCDCCAAPF